MGRFSNDDVAEMMEMYLVRGMSFQKIGEQFGLSASDVSQALRFTGVSGASNASGVAYGSGNHRGMYRSGIYRRRKDDREIVLDHALFKKYLREKDPGQSIFSYLENGPTRVTPKKVGAIAAGVVGAVILGDAIGVGNFFDIGRVDQFGGSNVESSSFKDDFVDEAKGIAKDKVKDAAKDTAIGALKSKFSNNSESKATKKEPGIFDYNGYSYLGRVSGGKPYKVCFELNQYGSRALGNYKGGELDGYGMKFNEGAILNIGDFKDGELSGVGITRKSGSIYVGKMKKGEPSGYAVRVDGDRNTIVKVSKKEIKEIGYVTNGKWYKSGKKVKEWKVKNNTYKGIMIVGGGITIDDTTVVIEGNNISYSNKDVNLKYNNGGASASYDSTKNDKKGTKLDYSGSSIVGEYHDVNLRVSTDITYE